MISLNIGKRRFALLIGKITNDSYSATIKKLALAKGPGFAQIAPAGLVAGHRHVAAALEQTFSAIEENAAFTKTPELEFLVRLFGEKQLDKILQYSDSAENEVILVADEKMKKIGALAKKLGLVEIKKFNFSKNEGKLMEFYGVGENEIAVLSDVDNPLEELVIEKISFVALER